MCGEKKNYTFVACLYNQTKDQELPLQLSLLKYLSVAVQVVNMAVTNGIVQALFTF
jgi:hypothetical protein